MRRYLLGSHVPVSYPRSSHGVICPGAVLVDRVHVRSDVTTNRGRLESLTDSGLETLLAQQPEPLFRPLYPADSSRLRKAPMLMFPRESIVLSPLDSLQPYLVCIRNRSDPDHVRHLFPSTWTSSNDDALDDWRTASGEANSTGRFTGHADSLQALKACAPHPMLN